MLAELLGRLTGWIQWPPPDTDRNRFLFRLTFPLATLAAVYVLTFALVSEGWLPYLVAVVLMVIAGMSGIGLLLMRARREELARLEAAELARGT
ncbi:hypothetical protein WCD74_22940 [Actinomycetospora sp. OC33-EN08]|uniref:DUF3040 domain-containing protein n=1 Tax=Actinomycetospora aurantiaca TaxID=3129233 RepID=A0ABU8MVL1_9PSEU